MRNGRFSPTLCSNRGAGNESWLELWRDGSHINEKEARIVLEGLKRSAGNANHHKTVVLSLGGNMSGLLSFESGRAKVPSLNALSRATAAFLISTVFSWRRRHCETARNPSDADSRFAT